MTFEDPEGALFAISAALEATAVKEFGQRVRSSYKDFISQNLGLITSIAFGRRVLNLNLAFDHPDLKKNSDGIYPIEEIFYHAVRCGLYHEAALSSNLRFAKEHKIVCSNGVLTLPASIMFGFIVAVVSSPSNATETTSKVHLLNFGELQIPISHLWGRRAELLWLLNAENEATRLRIEAERASSNGSLEFLGAPTA